MARKAVRLSDIAQKLGVSTVTVSNALANQKGVSEELRNKIKETAQEMGYKPVSSQPPAKGAATIAVLISEKYLDDHMTFYWKLYQELVAACLSENAFQLFEIVKQDSEKRLEMPLIIREGRAEGIVVMGELNRAYLRRLEEYELPLMFMDFYAGGFDVDCVISDNFYGMHTMTRYLVKKGHEDIAYVGTIFANSSITDRYFGYLKAIRQYGLEERAEWQINDHDPKTFKMLDNMVLPERMPTAFVCNCDLAASNLIHQLTQMGYRVPKDISVVGYDNFLFAGLCDIGITTYGVDMPEMARVAVNRLLARVRKEAQGPGRLFIVGGTLVEKESAAVYAKHLE